MIFGSKHFTRVAPATLFALALGACTAQVDAPRTAPRHTATPPFTSEKATRTSVDVDSPILPKDAALPWRFVGIKNSSLATCPSPKPGNISWNVSSLFDFGGTVPPGLDRFCLYERNTRANPKALLDLVNRGKLTALDSDYMATAGLGSALQEATWQPLRTHFLEQVGAVSLPATGTLQPRLAILDTGATREVDSGKYLGSSLHGSTLVNMAEGLLCTEGGSCLGQVTTQLALAYTAYSKESHTLSGRNEEEGGYIGTLVDLAWAIRKEVEAWQAAGGSNRLVLNLSLGWHPRFGGLESVVGNMPPPVQGVYDAIADAVCRGALVVVASGNTGGGPAEETGPLLPAAWESRLAPDFAACSTRLGTPPSGSDFPSAGSKAYRPLVYAAGGVRSNGEPLFNARPESEPRLVAYADHAVATNSGGNATAMLTGTSVSALVISSAAVAIWHYRPGLAPYEVMDLLHSGGDDLSRAPDFCLGGSVSARCPDSTLGTHRVSVCGAVNAACSSGASGCPSASSLPTCTTWSGEGPDLSSVDLSSFGGTSVDLDDDITTSYSTPPVCEGETLRYNSSATSPPTDPCPHHQYYGVPLEPWTDPQPSSDPCPPCWLESLDDGGLVASGGKLYIEIDSEFEGELTEATLVIGTETYNLGLGTLKRGDRAVVEDMPEVSSEDSVSISFTLNGDQSVSSAVLVEEG